MILTPTGFWIVVAILCCAALIVVVAEILRDRDNPPAPELEADVQQQVDRYHCAGHGCYLRVTDTDEAGTTWTCATCGRSSWVPRAEAPYDRENGVA